MTIAAAAAPPALSLASSLFEQVSTLTSAPSDGVYADCLISLAFGHLHSALGDDLSNHADELQRCAGAIDDCAWLPDAMRDHVSKTLCATASGVIPAGVALAVVLAASHRVAHQMLVDRARANGSDGLGAVADAVDAARNVRH